jgi:hypothetical protein
VCACAFARARVCVMCALMQIHLVELAADLADVVDVVANIVVATQTRRLDRCATWCVKRGVLALWCVRVRRAVIA